MRPDPEGPRRADHRPVAVSRRIDGTATSTSDHTSWPIATVDPETNYPPRFRLFSTRTAVANRAAFDRLRENRQVGDATALVDRGPRLHALPHRYASAPTTSATGAGTASNVSGIEQSSELTSFSSSSITRGKRPRKPATGRRRLSRCVRRYAPNSPGRSRCAVPSDECGLVETSIVALHEGPARNRWMP